MLPGCSRKGCILHLGAVANREPSSLTEDIPQVPLRRSLPRCRVSLAARRILGSAACFGFSLVFGLGVLSGEGASKAHAQSFVYGEVMVGYERVTNDLHMLQFINDSFILHMRSVNTLDYNGNAASRGFSEIGYLVLGDSFDVGVVGLMGYRTTSQSVRPFGRGGLAARYRGTEHLLVWFEPTVGKNDIEALLVTIYAPPITETVNFFVFFQNIAGRSSIVDGEDGWVLVQNLRMGPMFQWLDVGWTVGLGVGMRETYTSFDADVGAFIRISGR